MSCIYKYTLQAADGYCEIDIPRHSVFLSMNVIRDEIQLWFMAPSNIECDGYQRETFFLRETGKEFNGKGEVFHGTAVLMQGEYVLHIFQQDSIPPPPNIPVDMDELIRRG